MSNVFTRALVVFRGTVTFPSASADGDKQGLSIPAIDPLPPGARFSVAIKNETDVDIDIDIFQTEDFGNGAGPEDTFVTEILSNMPPGSTNVELVEGWAIADGGFIDAELKAASTPGGDVSFVIRRL